MKIHEYQTKILFREVNIPVLEGRVAVSADEAYAISKELGGVTVVKAQVHVGGRGKAGGVKVAKTPEEAKEYAKTILSQPLKGLPVRKVLVESGADIQQEIYLGIVLDRVSKSNILLFTPEGGIDVETLAIERPEALLKLPLTAGQAISDAQLDTICEFSKLPVSLHPPLRDIVKKLVDLYIKFDGELLEINPLVVTKAQQLVALDGKLVMDDNAEFRQSRILAFAEPEDSDPLELEAKKRKLAYVRLEGSIGIIGNGAGLVMGTMDEVQRAGGKPADFLDLGGGARADVVTNALQLLMMDSNIKGLLINIFGGITRCDEVAKGIISVLETQPIPVPIVVRLEGTHAAEGLALLATVKGLHSASSMQDGASKIVALAAAYTKEA